MPDYEWKSDYTIVEPGATEREIASVEARLGVRFPETLRQGFKVARNASLFKQGQYCGGAVTGPVAGGGRYVGSLSYLEPIDRIEVEKTDIAEYVADL